MRLVHRAWACHRPSAMLSFPDPAPIAASLGRTSAAALQTPRLCVSGWGSELLGSTAAQATACVFRHPGRALGISRIRRLRCNMLLLALAPSIAVLYASAPEAHSSALHAILRCVSFPRRARVVNTRTPDYQETLGAYIAGSVAARLRLSNSSRSGLGTSSSPGDLLCVVLAQSPPARVGPIARYAMAGRHRRSHHHRSRFMVRLHGSRSKTHR